MEQLDKWNKELDLLSSKSYKDMDDKLFKFYKKSLKQLKIETKSYIENYDSLSFSKRLEVDNQIKVANRIDEILWGLEAEKQPAIKDYIRGEANQGYYGTWYALEGNKNVQVDFGMLNENYIERLVEKKVAGKSLSKRLYEHRTQLANTVTNELLNGAVKGKGYAVVAKNIAEQTEASYKRALRIARTEGGRVQSTAKQRSYKEAEEKGIKLEKKWLATLDKKTRHAHQELDGQTVAVDDKFTFNGYEAEGPRLFGRASLDINCRCTTIAVVNGISPELRKDNVTKEIIDYKNYNDWYDSKDTRTNIKKKDYSDYVNVLGRKYKTNDFSKLLGKMSDDEYKKLGVLDITDNEVELITSKPFEAGDIMSKTNMQSRVGEENYNWFIKDLNKQEDKHIRGLYETLGDEITYKQIDKASPHAAGSNVQLTQFSFDGMRHLKPLEAVYHENGHALDALGLKKLTGQEFVKIGTKKQKTKVLRKTVEREVDININHASGLPKYKLKETIDKELWKHVNGDLPMISELGEKPSKKAEKNAWFDKVIEIEEKSSKNFWEWEKTIIEKYGKHNPDVAGLSDIYESTKLAGSGSGFGSGHGSKYWEPTGLAEAEFFAHISEAKTVNKVQLEILNKIFPDSIKIWETIVDDILKVGE